MKLCILHGITWNSDEALPYTVLFSYDPEDYEDTDEVENAAVNFASEENGYTILDVESVIFATED
jgi:hypothetical protein